MTQRDKGDPQPSVQDVALIVGGGPGISSSCARLFAENGLRVSIAARNPDKSVLQTLEKVSASVDMRAARFSRCFAHDASAG
jgi:NAD(P)-dependent dehydrogenase (short-subunit alcohol dehydrogenase family)